MHEIYEDIIT